MTYIECAQKHLSDSTFYRPVTRDLTADHNKQVSALVSELLQREAISPKVADYLIFDQPRTPCIYFLPKIHKAECPPPGRPIVSASGCPTERISALVDHFLSPYIPLLPSYIKDTNHFLQKIEELPPLLSTALIFTMDVKSLYTNIPNIEALKVAKATLNLHRDDTNEPLKNNDIVLMLALVLRCNNFEFNNDHYLQIQRVAMGTRSAPTVANLVMDDFEVKHVYTYPKLPFLWIRFIDDNIGIWLHCLSPPPSKDWWPLQPTAQSGGSVPTTRILSSMLT